MIIEVSMGQAKERALELEDRDYGEPEERLLCSDHFPDYGVKMWVESNGQPGRCHFCGKKHRVISASSIVSFIGTSIVECYTDPANEMGWVDGAYYSPDGKEPMKAYELFSKLGIYDIEPEELREDFIGCFAHHDWCVRDPYGMKLDEELSFMWHEFSRMVKHSRRFTFFRSPEFNREKPDPKSENGLFDILSEMEWAVNNNGLVETLPPGTVFYRGRVHKPQVIVDCLKELASPPSDSAKQNRMSPAGVSMFYGAYDEQTAQIEIEDGLSAKDKKEKNTTIGRFVTTRPLRLIDFSAMPEVSFFADDDVDTVAFLRSFAWEISQRVKNPEMVHVEYAPTQVITEFFRYVFKTRGKKSIHGLIYRSCHNHRPCVVLFMDDKMCPKYLNIEDPDKDIKLVRECCKPTKK